MSSNASGDEWHAKTLRAWQLAILRFAVTLDHADRLVVLAIAAEMDGLDPLQDRRSAFGFFRRISADLCTAILEPNERSSTLLGEYLARINDKRLKRVFAAAIEADQPKLPSVSKPIKRDNGLWRGLPPVTTKRTRAFSSEVDTGSREENASKQEIEPRSDSIGTEKALGRDGTRF
jgi:hypothetical protein